MGTTSLVGQLQKFLCQDFFISDNQTPFQTVVVISCVFTHHMYVHPMSRASVVPAMDVSVETFIIIFLPFFLLFVHFLYTSFSWCFLFTFQISAVRPVMLCPVLCSYTHTKEWAEKYLGWTIASWVLCPILRYDLRHQSRKRGPEVSPTRLALLHVKGKLGCTHEHRMEGNTRYTTHAGLWHTGGNTQPTHIKGVHKSFTVKTIPR